LLPHSLTHGAESLRSCKFCSHSWTYQRFMEPEGTLLCSQEPCPEPASPKIHFNIVHPPMSWSSQWSPSFWISHQYPRCIPPRPHSCYMPYQSHPPWLDHSNYTWRRVQVMKRLCFCSMRMVVEVVPSCERKHECQETPQSPGVCCGNGFFFFCDFRELIFTVSYTVLVPILNTYMPLIFMLQILFF
jgi:hypothetical protein